MLGGACDRLGASRDIPRARLFVRCSTIFVLFRRSAGVIGLDGNRDVLARHDRRLADGQHARISRHHDARLDADVAAQRFILSDPCG